MLNNCVMFFVVVFIHLFNFNSVVVIFTVDLIVGNPLVRFIELSMKS